MSSDEARTWLADARSSALAYAVVLALAATTVLARQDGSGAFFAAALVSALWPMLVVPPLHWTGAIEYETYLKAARVVVVLAPAQALIAAVVEDRGDGTRLALLLTTGASVFALDAWHACRAGSRPNVRLVVVAAAMCGIVGQIGDLSEPGSWAMFASLLYGGTATWALSARLRTPSEA